MAVVSIFYMDTINFKGEEEEMTQNTEVPLVEL